MWLLRGAVVCLTCGGAGWVVTWPKGERMRATVRAAVVLAVVAALGGAALWIHYATRWKTLGLTCAPALIAPTREARDAALREGLGPLFPVIDPHASCLELLREKRRLETSGDCPTFVMNDVSCRCGAEHRERGSAPRCATGPTACQSRESGESLGCAEHGSRYTLEEARGAEAERGAR